MKTIRAVLWLASALGAAAAMPAGAAASFQLLTPRATAIAAGESQVVSVRFLDAAGRPSAGETVRFSNDACGIFPNKLGAVELTTDGNGVVSTIFTASPPGGITCWINANAGGTVAVIDVLTYRLGGAYLVLSSNPAEPRPGEPFTITAMPRSGAYPLMNVEVTARVSGGPASLTPASGNTGMRGAVEFRVTPTGEDGDVQVEIDYRGKKGFVEVESQARTYQDLWWAGPSEDGWGMSIVQRGDALFSVLYAYDERGAPTWFVMPGGNWDATRTRYSGPLYQPTGSPFFAYDRGRFLVGPAVGQATLVFDGTAAAQLTYSIHGAGGSKRLTRQPFGPPDAAATPAFGDLWWGGSAQDGWGIAVLQQFRTLFSVWYTYDAQGAPTWLVMPAGHWVDEQTYECRIYRTSGAPWVGRAYDPKALRVTDVGSYRIRFSAGAATFDYSVDGRTGSLPLQRQLF